MAFTRVGGAFPVSTLQRASCKHPFSNFFMRMSSQTSPSQPPEMKHHGSSRRYAFGAAFGGLLTCGLGFAYKTYTDQKFGFSNQFKWIQDKIGMEAPSKFDMLTHPIVKFFGSENQASCAAKDECPPTCGDSICLHKMDKEEETIAKANGDLEKALKDVKPKAMEATEAALKAYCEAAAIIKLFMDKVYCAIEQDDLQSPQFEEVWCDVYETALKRCEIVMDAMKKGECAWQLLCRLREVIENGKACKYTQCNPLLLTAEQALLCAERELTNAKARLDCIQSESCLVEQYRKLIEDFRQDLKAEIDTLLAANPECRETFCDNPCPMILTQAYKMVFRVQKELAQFQVCNEKVPPNQQKTLC